MIYYYFELGMDDNDWLLQWSFAEGEDNQAVWEQLMAQQLGWA